jgi:hypothetical protein
MVSTRKYQCISTLHVGREKLSLTCGHEHITLESALDCQRKMQAMGGCWWKRTTDGKFLTAEEANYCMRSSRTAYQTPNRS